MSKIVIEKQWVTASGLRAKVVATPMGHRCGYVAVPKGILSEDYNDINVNVHGGLTYGAEEDDISWVFWYGFDCDHSCDAKDFSIMSDTYKKIYKNYAEQFGLLYEYQPKVRTLEYCMKECEALATQLADLIKEKYNA